MAPRCWSDKFDRHRLLQAVVVVEVVAAEAEEEVVVVVLALEDVALRPHPQLLRRPIQRLEPFRFSVAMPT